MPSLTTCLRKAGDLLPASDRAEIQAAAQALREGGLKPAEAARAAVADHLARAQQALDEAQGRFDAGGKPGQGATPESLAQTADAVRTSSPDLAAQIDRLLGRGDQQRAPEPVAPAIPGESPQIAAVRAQFPDLMVQMDGMEKPMPMAEFLAAAKAEADDLAADAPLMQVAAECGLMNGLG